MADAQLSVELTAKIDALRDGFNQAVREAGKWDSATQKALDDVDKGFVKLANDVEKSSNTVSRSLAKAAQASATSGKAITVGTNQAAFALTNLGRVAQDAPFGFIGIQNNLNPLLESFQRLRAESGSNSAAFKQLGQSLIGPAGLGLALSLVGSAIVIYQQYQQKANKATNDAKKVTDEYVKSLDSVTGAQLKGAQNAQKELTDLGILFATYNDGNNSLKLRKEAYKQLQEIYPSYFGNLKFEQEVGDKTKKVYQELTQAILASARARAASDKITQNESRKLENEQKIIDLQKEQDKNNRDLLNSEKARSINRNSAFKNAQAAQGEEIASADEANAIRDKINSNLSLSNNLKTDSNKLDKENARLVGYVNTQLEKGAKLQGGFGGALKKPKITRDNTKTLGSLPELLGLGDLSKPFLIEPKLVIKPIATGLNELLEIAATAEKAIDRITSLPNAVNLAAVTLGTSFEAMGSAIAQGGDVVSAAGEVLQSAFADILSQLGQQFITMGAAKIAAGILATPFGGKLIADGAGLVALGAGLSLGGGLVKSAGKGKAASPVTAFANGGIISGPTLGLMGEYAGAKSDPEVVAPLSKLKKMLGQQDSAGNPITPANQQPVYVQQRLEIQGTKLVALIDTVESQNKRRG